MAPLLINSKEHSNDSIPDSEQGNKALLWYRTYLTDKLIVYFSVKNRHSERACLKKLTDDT